MAQKLAFFLIALSAAFGLGEAVWRIAIEAPDLLWPALGRQQAWAWGALAALLFAAAVRALAGPMDWSRRERLQIWILGVAPWTLGALAGHLRRVRLPAPHDVPLRSLQLTLAAAVITGLALAAAAAFRSLQRQSAHRPPRWIALRLFALGWGFYLCTGLWTGHWIMTGDAPHYLVITDSLVHDQDSDLKNQYEQERWRAFYDRAELDPQFAPQPDGRRVSLHRPGVPFLFAPAYALMGATGARWTQAGIASATAALLFLVLVDAGYAVGLALLGWALLAGSAVWIVHACGSMAELPAAAALVLAWAAWRRLLPAWAGALAAGFLLLVNVRFYPLSAWLLACVLAFARGRRERVPALLAWAGMAVALAAVSIADFHSLDPLLPFRQNSYGADELAQTHNLFRNLAAVLLDQEYGFLFFGPAFSLSLIGFWAWWRRAPDLALPLLPAVASILVPVCVFIYWHGDMAPARYLVVLAPVLAAASVEAMRAWGLRRLMRALLALHFTLGLAMAILPWMAFSKKNGANTLLAVLERLGAWQLTRYFPSFIISNPASIAWGAGAVLVLAIAALKLGPPAAWDRRP